jgi:hypothetical protein
MSGRWRIKLACWIAGDPMRLAEVQAADLIKGTRKASLKEAAEICEERANFYQTHPEAASKDPLEYQGAYSMGAQKCAQLIRESIESSPDFDLWLRENLPHAIQTTPKAGKGAG